MIDLILSIDRNFLYSLNARWGGSFFDHLMMMISGPYPWILIVGFLIFWVLKKQRGEFIRFAILIAVTLSITDLFCYRVLKPWIARKRPCIELRDLRLIEECGSEFGFPSNHAANSIVVVSLFYLQFRHKKLTLFLGLFAALVGYSRVYLAAHYPLDVLAGYFVGVGFALCGYFISLYLVQWIAKKRVV